MERWIIDNLEILHTFSCSSWAFSLLIFWSSAMRAAVSSSSESESSSSSESSNGSSASKLFALALPGPSNLALLLELDWTEGLEEDGRSLPRIFLSVFSRLASLSLSSSYTLKRYLIIPKKTVADFVGVVSISILFEFFLPHFWSRGKVNLLGHFVLVLYSLAMYVKVWKLIFHIIWDIFDWTKNLIDWLNLNR